MQVEYFLQTWLTPRGASIWIQLPIHYHLQQYSLQEVALQVASQARTCSRDRWQVAMHLIQDHVTRETAPCYCTAL